MFKAHPSERYTCQPYIIQDGDTLESLAERHNMTVDVLTSANRDVDFVCGQKICIPVSERS